MADVAKLTLAVESKQVVTATKRLDDLNKSGAISEKKVLGIASAWKVAAGAAAGFIGAFASFKLVEATISKFVSSTIEAERVVAQLDAVIRSTGGAAGMTTNELRKMASEFQSVTTYGDEAIASAAALLLTFTKIGRDEFPRATEAVLNVATAMGTDLNSAALQVGKALNDPLLGMTALSRSGIQFTKDQKDTVKALIETGDVAKAQKIILKELEVQFGDSARAARGTLGGALTALNEAFGDLFEANGPQSERLRDAVEDLIDGITDPAFISAVQNLGASLLSAFADALPAITEIIKLVSDFFGTMAAERANPKLKYWNSQGDAGSVDAAARRAAEVMNSGRGHRAGEGSFGSMDDFFGRPLQQPAAEGAIIPPRGGGKDEDLPSGLSSGASTTKAYESLIKNSEIRIKTLEAEAAAIGMTSSEAAKYLTVQGLLSDASQREIELSPDRIAQLTALGESIAYAQEQTALLQEGYDMMLEANPFDKLGKDIAHLDDLLAAGAISWEVYGQSVAKATAMASGQMFSFAGEAAGLLGQMFEDSKEVAIAQAVIAAGEGIAKTMGAYPFPWNLGMAALHAGVAITQISKIAATNKNSKSLPGGADVGGGAAASAPQAAASNSTIAVKGLDANSFFSGDAASSLIKTLLEKQRDGATIVFDEQ